MDARRLLTINTGSSSLKAALYRLREDKTETPELRAEDAPAALCGGKGRSRADLQRRPVIHVVGK